MTMLCRISDEYISNPWEDDSHEPEMKHMEDITLYDLMASDNYVWVGKSNGFGFDLEIENDACSEPYLCEKNIHPAAMESMALFCRRFLAFYEQCNKEL